MATKMRDFWKSDVVKDWSGAATPPAPPTPAPAGSPAPAGGPAPESTSTDLFFDWKSDKLTSSAKKSLEDYAKAYVAAKSSETIVIDAYASKEGDASFNQDLSNKRANAAAAYLKGQPGMSQVKIEPKGGGATDIFSKDDLGQNRRATLKPPPAPPPPSGKLKMREPTPLTKKDKKPGLPPLPDSVKDKILDEPVVPPPPPATTVPRAKVLEDLTDFLKKLAQHQNSKDGRVTSTDKVYLADVALHQGLGGGGAPTKRGGHGGQFDPAGLASQIVQDLPAEVPVKNHKDFLELEPIDTPVDLTLTDHAHNKYKAARDKLIDAIPVLPKKLKDKLKEKMDEAVKKGAEWILDQAMDEAGLPDDVKKKLKEFFQERVKEVVDGKKKEKK